MTIKKLAALVMLSSCSAIPETEIALIQAAGVADGVITDGPWVELFADSNFQGRSWIVTGDVANFRHLWNSSRSCSDYLFSHIGSNTCRHAGDVVSSLRVHNGGSITLYMDDTFRGDSRTYSSDQPTLHRQVDGRLGDNASSAKVTWPYVQLFVDDNYGGKSWTISGAISDLHRIWSNDSNVDNVEHANDKVSSLRVFNDASVTLYIDTNFGEGSRTYGSDQPTLHRTEDGAIGDNSSSSQVW